MSYGLLRNAVEQLSADSLDLFLGKLAKNLRLRSHGDLRMGRPFRAQKLDQAANRLFSPSKKTQQNETVDELIMQLSQLDYLAHSNLANHLADRYRDIALDAQLIEGSDPAAFYRRAEDLEYVRDCLLVAYKLSPPPRRPKIDLPINY